MHVPELTSAITVDFVAAKLHVDRQGVIWAYLANGMICSVDSRTGMETEHFGDTRFDTAFFCATHCYLISMDRVLVRFAYDSPSLESIGGFHGACHPLFVMPQEKKLVFQAGHDLVMIDVSGNELHRWPMNFTAYSLTHLDGMTFCVGGSELIAINLATGSIELIEQQRETPFFDLSFDSKHSRLFAAGIVDLGIYELDGWNKVHAQNLAARWCDYTADDQLWVSNDPGDRREPIVKRISIGDLKVYSISNGAFTVSKAEDKTSLVVSGYEHLYVYRVPTN